MTVRPIARILPEDTFQHFPQKRRHIARNLIVYQQDFFPQLTPLAFERLLPGDHPIQEDSDGPNVSKNCIIGLFHQYLGTHITRSAAIGIQRLPSSTPDAKPKVYQFGIIVLGHQHIPQLDVPMVNILVMQKIQRVHAIIENFRCNNLWNFPVRHFFNLLLQRGLASILHDDIQIFTSLIYIIKFDDIRMLLLLAYAYLIPDIRDSMGLGQVFFLIHFDCIQLSSRLFFGNIDFCVCPLADTAFD